jgi:hypothetical protein
MALLSRELLKLFAQGHLTGTQVQSLARAAWTDGWGHMNPLAKQLAKPGVDLTKAGNIARDVINAAKEHGICCSRAEPYVVELPDNKGSLNIFLPHEVYPNMTEDNLDAWCLSQATLDAGKELGLLLGKWAAHTDVGFTGDLTKVGVLGMHCDGVAYTTSLRAGVARTILVASWNIISAESDLRRNKRQPLFVIRKERLCKCGCGGYHTLQLLFQVVAWSLQCMLAGQAPDCRHDSSPWTEFDNKVRIASGLPLPTAALLQVRGDWEWLTECFKLRSYNSHNFCWMCDATLTPGELCYHDFSPSAQHRDTMFTHQTYLQKCTQEAVQPSTIFRCPGVGLEHLCVDSMHAGDLGTFQDALGSLFWVEISHKGWHRNIRTGLIRLNEDLKRFYTANKDDKLSSLHPIVLSQIKSDSHYPNLKSKAAQCRHLAEFGLILANRHRSGAPGRPPFEFKAGHRLAGFTEDYLNNLVACFEGLAKYHRSCGACPFDERTCREALYQYLQALGNLNKIWRVGLMMSRRSICLLLFVPRPT